MNEDEWMKSDNQPIEPKIRTVATAAERNDAKKVYSLLP